MTTLPCPPEHWPAFSRRLDPLMALSPAQRSAALAHLPPDEQLLRPWLEAVLAKLPQSEAADFLAAPSLGGTAGHAEHPPGQRIGPYQQLRELGRGGMGVVWLARRVDGAYSCALALKLPHAHLLVGAVRNLGLTQMQAGDLAGAATSLGRAADIAERTTGPGHPTAWLPRVQQARTLHLAGDRVTAKRLFNALLAVLPPPQDSPPDAHRVREDYRRAAGRRRPRRRGRAVAVAGRGRPCPQRPARVCAPPHPAQPGRCAGGWRWHAAPASTSRAFSGCEPCPDRRAPGPESARPAHRRRPGPWRPPPVPCAPAWPAQGLAQLPARPGRGKTRTCPTRPSTGRAHR